MLFYFVLMKYNLTNESHLTEVVGDFPGATEMTWEVMISVSLFYNIIPLVVSLILYYPIVYVVRKLVKPTNLLSLTITGFFLTLTTPILYVAFAIYKPFNNQVNLAESISWTLCFASSISLYIMLNKGTINSNKLTQI
jgi:hypothetical protein